MLSRELRDLQYICVVSDMSAFNSIHEGYTKIFTVLVDCLSSPCDGLERYLLNRTIKSNNQIKSSLGSIARQNKVSIEVVN